MCLSTFIRTWNCGLSVLIGTLRLRSLRAKSEENKEALMKHFQLGHEICSMAACASAWEQCVDEENEYDLGTCAQFRISESSF